MEVSDSLLVEKMAQDNRTAFSNIYDKYYKRLYAMAIYKTNNRVIAEELVQEIFISIWEKRKSNQIQSLENYLFVSLKYLIIGHLKNLLKTKKVELTEAHESGTLTTFENFSADELREAIDNSVDNLPIKTREVFRYSRYENLSHKQIAELLDITEKNVEYHIAQALKVLRVMVAEYI